MQNDTHCQQNSTEEEMKIRLYTLMTLAMLTVPAMAQVKPVNKKGTYAMSPRAKALFEDMLPNTQKIFIIDSTVVDCNNVLDCIPLPKDYGQFVPYDKFFGKHTGNKSAVFVNGFNNRCYYTEPDADSIPRLYMCDKLGEEWGKPVAIKEINDNFTDISFPYMSSDGQTLYFAGVSTEDGLGRRDIYMTKYDADDGTFMPAENIGLPFNSAADDYAFVIADAHKLAWFATTRRQPAGKVCVYTFVPADTRQNYNEEETGRARLINLAGITSIRATWPSDTMRERAIARLKQLQKSSTNSVATTGSNINFVVDDNNTYTSIDDFRSDDTRLEYHQLTKKQSQLDETLKNTEILRKEYHNANNSQKQTIASKIAQLEEETAHLRAAIKSSEKSLRQKESRLIKNQ